MTKSCSALLQCLKQKVKEDTRDSEQRARHPREYFAYQQIYLTACLIERKLARKCLSYLHIREYFENLGCLHDDYAARYGAKSVQIISSNLRSMLLCMEQLTTYLEQFAGVPPTDWMEVARMYSNELFSSNQHGSELRFLPQVSDLSPIELIAAGSFGSMYLATLGPPEAGVVLALKLVNMINVHDSTLLTDSRVFAAVMEAALVCRQYCSFATLEAYVLISEPFIGITLYRVVKALTRLTDHRMLEVILAQLALALQHVHSQGFMHRNIKPSSVTVNSKGQLRLTEFEKCKICLGRYTPYRLRVFDCGAVAEFADRSRVGSVSYMAPEMLMCKPYGRSADWWSFGVTAFALYTGRIPYSGKDYAEQKQAIISGSYELPKETSGNWDKMESLLAHLLQVNPHRRLCSVSYKDVWRHSFFKDVDTAQLQTAAELVHIPIIDELRQQPVDPKKASIRFEDLTREPTLSQDGGTKNQRSLFTFVSPGFLRVMKRIRADEKFTVSDLKEHTAYCNPEDPYVYKYRRTLIRRNPLKSADDVKSESAFPSLLIGIPKSQDAEPTTSRPSSFMDFVKKWELQGAQTTQELESPGTKLSKVLRRISAASKQPRVVDMGSDSLVRRQGQRSSSDENKGISRSPCGASNVSSVVRAEAAKTGSDVLSLEFGYSLVETRKPSFGLFKLQSSPNYVQDNSVSRTQSSQSAPRETVDRPKLRRKWYNKLFFGRQE